MSFLEDNEIYIDRQNSNDSVKDPLKIDLQFNTQDYKDQNILYDAPSPIFIEEHFGDDEASGVPTKKFKITTPKSEERKEDVITVLKDIRDSVKAKDHPIRLFFESIAETVIGLPVSSQAQIKFKVCQIVTEMEIKTAQSTSNGYCGKNRNRKSKRKPRKEKDNSDSIILANNISLEPADLSSQPDNSDHQYFQTDNNDISKETTEQTEIHDTQIVLKISPENNIESEDYNIQSDDSIFLLED